jgi:hypothetical protein
METSSFGPSGLLFLADTMTFEGHREVLDEEDFLPLLLSVNGQFERLGRIQ